MRIALVSQEYPPETSKGGIGTQTWIKARGLAALGHQVEVISRSPSDEATERTEGPVHLTRVPGLGARLELHTELADWITYSGEVAAAVARLHRATPFDVVDFPEWGCEGYVHLLNRSAWNRVPTVIHLHGPLVMFAHTMGWPALDSEFYRTGTQMEGTCLRLADAVFSSSQCSADWCAKHYGLDRARIPVLHTGVDTRHFSPQPGGKAARPTIVFVGRLSRNKGVVQLLRVACALAKEIPGLRLRVIGRGEDAVVQEMQELAKSGPSDLLELAGPKSRAELPAELSAAHVFAAPSFYEGGPGFVYLEAMACGLPVIACQGSGAAEAIVDGQTGLLVPSADDAALMDALRRLLTDPSLRERLGRAGREHVRAHADSEDCLRRLEAFYTQVSATATSPSFPRDPK
jgi:phosphatidylinositol alpha-1,6-mannosyltransferase